MHGDAPHVEILGVGHEVVSLDPELDVLSGSEPRGHPLLVYLIQAVHGRDHIPCQQTCHQGLKRSQNTFDGRDNLLTSIQNSGRDFMCKDPFHKEGAEVVHRQKAGKAAVSSSFLCFFCY